MSQFSISAYAQTAVEHSRRTILLLLSDCLVLFGAVVFSGVLRQLIPGAEVESGEYIHLLLLLFLAPLLNYLGGLYGPTPPALPEELRELGISTSLAYVCIAVFSLLENGNLAPSRFGFVFSWILSLGLVPLVRVYVREYFSRKFWWRIPAVLCGSGSVASSLNTYLRKHPQCGLTPLALYEGEKELPPVETGLLVLEDEAELRIFHHQHPDACALVIIEKDAPHKKRQALVDQATLLFSSVILVHEELGNGEVPFWIRPLEIGNLLCLKIRQNLLDPRRLILKRCMDLILSFIGCIVLLPVFVLIGLCIVIESPGPVFFRQNRIGRDGKVIRILKFRTMVKDAESVLQRYLDSNPELRAEWEADQKLRHDPRITRVGSFLRRMSLDELPQLWNVLCGEMSLVGPRPIVSKEIVRYGTAFGVYKRVRPGITGLWQVSGRNDLSYEQRVHCDRYYISNWSIWMDILILAKTIPVVLKCKGAY